ncbi:MAG: PRC-barrel domain-containing protein [Janthinobacterium lividum]
MSDIILRRLRDLPTFELVPGDPDVRGWAVRGSDGQPFGTVHELLVDPLAQQVLYLNVELVASLPGVPKAPPHTTNHILLPLAAVQFDNEGKSVFVTALSHDTVRTYPLFRDFMLPPGLEEAMQQALVSRGEGVNG